MSKPAGVPASLPQCLHPGKAKVPARREQVRVLSRWSDRCGRHAGENFKRSRKVNLIHLLENEAARRKRSDR